MERGSAPTRVGGCGWWEKTRAQPYELIIVAQVHTSARQVLYNPISGRELAQPALSLSREINPDSNPASVTYLH